MTRSSRPTRIRVPVAIGGLLMLLMLAAIFVRPVRASSDNTNLIQQILAIVQQIETELTSLIGTPTDVSAIKAKTDKLPADTAAVLTDIQLKIGYGPMTRMAMHWFRVGTGHDGSMTCSSTGPYLAYVHADGLKASVTATSNGYNVTANQVFGTPTSLTLGGNAGDALNVRLIVEDEYNPNAYGAAAITLQTTEGAFITCQCEGAVEENGCR